MFSKKRKTCLIKCRNILLLISLNNANHLHLIIPLSHMIFLLFKDKFYTDHERYFFFFFSFLSNSSHSHPNFLFFLSFLFGQVGGLLVYQTKQGGKCLGFFVLFSFLQLLDLLFADAMKF